MVVLQFLPDTCTYLLRLPCVQQFSESYQDVLTTDRTRAGVQLTLLKYNHLLKDIQAHY